MIRRIRSLPVIGSDRVRLLLSPYPPNWSSGKFLPCTLCYGVYIFTMSFSMLTTIRRLSDRPLFESVETIAIAFLMFFTQETGLTVTGAILARCHAWTLRYYPRNAFLSKTGISKRERHRKTGRSREPLKVIF
jgi:hypothetical protein